MKSNLIVKGLLFLAGLKQVFGACNIVGNPIHAAAHNFMGNIAGIQAKRVNELFLLGSHDAGSYGAGLTSLPWYAPRSWAFTQTENLESQMCSGYRVFDIRFTGAGASAGWTIVHNVVLFETMNNVVTHILNFCTDPTHVNEVVILRTKVTGASRAAEAQFLTDFATAIGDCLVPVVNNGDFASMTLAQIVASPRSFPNPANLGAPNRGAVLIMHYSGGGYKAVENPPGTFAWADPNNLGQFVWPYSGQYKEPHENGFRQVAFGNMEGRYSESGKVTAVVQAQQTKYTNYWGRHTAVAPAVAAPTIFGYWMTLTYGNVLSNTRSKIFDNVGKYGGFIHQLITSQFIKASGSAGIVVWTDFAGDAGLASVPTVMVQVNTNIVGNVAHTTGVNVPARVVTRPGSLLKKELSVNNALLFNPNPPVFRSKKSKAKKNKKGGHQHHLKAESEVDAKVMNWVDELKWCEEANDDEVEYDEELTKEEKSKSNCASHHVFQVDDTDDLCVMGIPDEVDILCNLCDSKTKTPFIDFAGAKELCPPDANNVIDQLASLNCCNIAEFKD